MVQVAAEKLSNNDENSNVGAANSLAFNGAHIRKIVKNILKFATECILLSLLFTFPYLISGENQRKLLFPLFIALK